MQREAAGWLVLGFVFAPFLLTGCSPQTLFYYPNRKLYATPEQLGLAYEVVQYPSLNGKTLYGIFIRTPQKPKGTVVHFHGNFGNVSNHFPLAVFLVNDGFDVLAFDYEGYGASEGHPSPQATVEDGRATVRYAQAHRRDPQTGVGVFGQSLGGAAAIVVAAQEPEVKALVIEAAFSSYRAMGRWAMERHLITWPLVPFSIFLSRSDNPIDFIAAVSPRPVLFIHGDQDKTVPYQMSQELYAKAQEPKTLWIVPGADHLASHRVAGQQYDQKINEFFTQALAKGNAAK